MLFCLCPVAMLLMDWSRGALELNVNVLAFRSLLAPLLIISPILLTFFPHLCQKLFTCSQRSPDVSGIGSYNAARLLSSKEFLSHYLNMAFLPRP